MPNIALIGCGKMGSALLRGWLAAGVKDHIHVLDPHEIPAEFLNDSRISTYTDAAQFVADAQPLGLAVIAVKPQTMETACAGIAKAIGPQTLVLSIAAGQTIASFEKRFGAQQPVVRSMPNTPAAIGKGMTVAVANAFVAAAQKGQAHDLLKVTGAVEWIEDENLLNAVTALSGSGPAYVFHLIEVLAEAGARSGLPRDFAMKLARQTVIGSAALADHDAGTDAATLRQNVTSPGGTTEAALKVLRDSGAMQKLFDNALAAATKRGVELSK